MRTVNIGGESVELRGSALAPLTWYDAFGDDGLYDALADIESQGARPRMPMRDILRVAWVMARDADMAAGRPVLGFEAWVAAHPDVDFVELKSAVLAEAMGSFFPGLAEQVSRAVGQLRAAQGAAAGHGQEDGPEPSRDGVD